MPVTTRSQVRSTEPKTPITTPRRSRAVETPKTPVVPTPEPVSVPTPKSIDLTPSEKKEMVKVVTLGKKSTKDISGRHVEITPLPHSTKKYTTLFDFSVPWQRKLYIEDCLETGLSVNPEYINYEYDETKKIYRIPMDDDFHNTLAHFYIEKDMYLVPLNDFYYKSVDDGKMYLQFKVSDEFGADDAVETFTFPRVIAKNLIGYFLNVTIPTFVESKPAESVDGSKPAGGLKTIYEVTQAVYDKTQKYYTAILMYFWSQGIYVNALYNKSRYSFEFQNYLIKDF